MPLAGEPRRLDTYPGTFTRVTPVMDNHDREFIDDVFGLICLVIEYLGCNGPQASQRAEQIEELKQAALKIGEKLRQERQQ